MSTPPRPIRPLWVVLGFVLTGLGFMGLILPGFPGTVWFILAAAAFARGDPRWEAWLLSRPVIGQLVSDYRSGRGMPLRAKWFACVCIVLAVGFSLPRIPVLVGQVAWVVLGVVYIVWRVPTKRG
ncbi:YbaN family protein [Deinococcus sp. QL22]|uniref:YbaN family protein n=1 Tax=Deinococcus sp. QL22 TaxID=2939437 RepID=UPI0020182A2E|nr:YbaN family protein [Deinococcus sp. QL22]UQN07101.1 YbaN family protein [Deinococcus sp. QL22]